VPNDAIAEDRPYDDRPYEDRRVVDTPYDDRPVVDTPVAPAGVGRFTHDTSVSALGDGRYAATVDPGWAVIDGAAPNGGYMMAIGARAMADAGGKPDPLSVTAHYLAPSQPGPVEVHTEVVRSGGRHSTVTASLTQDGRPMLQLLGVFTDLVGATGPTVERRSAPPLPPRVDCVPASVPGPGEPDQRPPIFRRFEHHLPPDVMGWAAGRPTGAGAVGGYLRWADGEPMDVFGLLVVADCYPPAVFNVDGLTVGWAPTIELTVQVRKRPAPGWLSGWFTTESVTGGYLEEDGQVRDATGELVALSRQLALVPRT
jgi:hypothetical protein